MNNWRFYLPGNLSGPDPVLKTNQFYLSESSINFKPCKFIEFSETLWILICETQREQKSLSQTYTDSQADSRRSGKLIISQLRSTLIHKKTDPDSPGSVLNKCQPHNQKLFQSKVYRKGVPYRYSFPVLNSGFFKCRQCPNDS